MTGTFESDMGGTFNVLQSPDIETFTCINDGTLTKSEKLL